jgi:predicted transcriptional regulator of viral defense system
MGGKLVTPDAAIADLAAAQHGVVALRQLRALGMSDRAVHGRAARGLLHRVHQGVYAVGHTVLSVHGGWMAAVLAAGEGAVLSHRAAAALWSLYGAPASSVDVIVTGRARSRPGLRVHRHALREDEVTERDSIPVTTVAPTLLDLAGVVTPRGVERAIDHDGGMATADFLWRHERLVVETDGAATHRTHGAFEWDRHRDVQLTLAGYEVVRFTWRQITESPQRTADAVAELLRRRRAGDPGRP